MKGIAFVAVAGLLLFAAAGVLTGDRPRGENVRGTTRKEGRTTYRTYRTEPATKGRIRGTTRAMVTERTFAIRDPEQRTSALRDTFLRAAREYAELLNDNELEQGIKELEEETAVRRQKRQANEREAQKQLDDVERVLLDIIRKQPQSQAARTARNMLNARRASGTGFRGRTERTERTDPLRR
jgi:hypothetical protein